MSLQSAIKQRGGRLRGQRGRRPRVQGRCQSMSPQFPSGFGGDAHGFGGQGFLVGSRHMMEASLPVRLPNKIEFLHHQDRSADSDGKARAPSSAFAGDRGDDGNMAARHLAQVVGNGFCLSALLPLPGRDRPGVSTNVNNGRPNFSAILSRHGLAVALGVGHAEVCDTPSAWCHAPSDVRRSSTSRHGTGHDRR